MKIAELTHTFFPVVGGAEVCIHNLARTLGARGHEVVVLAPAAARELRADLPYRLRLVPPKALPAAARLPGGRTALAPLVRWIQQREGFDLWHIHFLFPTAFAVHETLARLGVPCLVTSHGADVQVCEPARYGLRRDPRIDRKIRRCVTRVPWLGAITESIRAEYLALGADPRRIVLLPNGIDLERFRSERAEREAARSELGWPPGATILLTVGRNHAKKGFHRIPAIAARLRDQGRSFRWFVVGRDTEPVQRRAAELGLGDVLHVVPQIGVGGRSGPERYDLPPPAIVRLYRAADVFAFPTLMEAHPLVLLEAMAAGTAIATTDAPGCRDLLEDEVTALLSPVGDDEAMAATLLRLVDDAELRRRLASRALAAVEAFDWPRIGGLYDEFLAAAVEGSG